MPDTGSWWFRWPAHLIRSFVAEIGASESAELTFEAGESAGPAFGASESAGPTFEDGVAAQEALDTVLLAVNERRWVDLSR
jgi:hypothetical protein